MKYVRLTLACPKSYDFENKKENWHLMVQNVEISECFYSEIASQFHY